MSDTEENDDWSNETAFSSIKRCGHLPFILRTFSFEDFISKCKKSMVGSFALASIGSIEADEVHRS